MIRIQTGQTERVEVLALDKDAIPLTSLVDLLLSIRRGDGYYYDFDDDTFKNSGWTTRQIALSEIDSTNSPGEYYYDFDTSAITNPTADDTYQIRAEQDPGTTVKNMPQTGEIKVGQYVDNIDIKTSAVWDEAFASHVANDSMGFVMRLIKAFVKGNKTQSSNQFIINDPETDLPWLTFNTKDVDGNPADVAVYDVELV